jgi:hypothetical protein
LGRFQQPFKINRKPPGGDLQRAPAAYLRSCLGVRGAIRLHLYDRLPELFSFFDVIVRELPEKGGLNRSKLCYASALSDLIMQLEILLPVIAKEVVSLDLALIKMPE